MAETQTQARDVKLPGPDHPITVTPNTNRVRVTFNGQTVADTTRALTLQEASYKPVFYIPREDANPALLERTSHASYCPYKGGASYYTIKAGDKTAANAVWSYETPHPAMNEIKEYVAFYPNRVDAIQEEKA